jgi:hypothetical protein
MILQYFEKFSNFFPLEKWFSRNRSETAEFGKKIRRNFRHYTGKILQTLGFLSNMANGCMLKCP